MKTSEKKKDGHSIFSNIFFFMGIMFRISPVLVIGECLSGIFGTLPTRLIAVLGVKYVTDVIENGGDRHKIVYGILFIAAVLLVTELLTWFFREFVWNVEREKLIKGLNTKFFNKARQLDLEAYDDPHFYNSFILAVEASAGHIQWILNMVERYIGELVSLAAISTVLLTVDPICLVIIIASVAIFTPIGKKIGMLQSERRIENNKYHRRADYFARIFYLQDYAKEVRMNNIRPLLTERYNDAADDVIRNQKKYVAKIDFYYFIQEGGLQIISFMFLLPLYLGYCVLVSKTLSAGDFVAAFNGAAMIAGSFSFLTIFVARTFSEQAKIIEKYREFLARKNKILDGGHIAQGGEPEKIEFKNVSFTYPGNSEPTLKKINLTLKPGEKIALVGYNGAGKTTLTNLLLRLYDVTEGEILIGGRDIREETVASHRKRFAAVFQDFQLFAASLGENVALDTDFDYTRAANALARCGFTKELADGLDTELLREFNDSGVMLSGGEAQKVAVSRAFYKKCPYVIMDEPSANLDPVAEYNLNRAMAEASENKTVVFISHRLSTTRGADRIYIMENGEIVESGAHEELMKLNGKYAYMFNLQAEKYRKGDRLD